MIVDEFLKNGNFLTWAVASFYLLDFEGREK